MPVIYLVEDNAADVQLFRMALDTAGVDCELMVFEDGREILDYIEEGSDAEDRRRPDLLILDLNLPKIDGVEVLRSIRSIPGYADAPLAVISSSSSPRDRLKLGEFNIIKYIVKPADLDEYLRIGETVRGLLERSAVQRSEKAT